MPYPVTFKADYVEKRSRLTTFFRLLLAIPHLIAVTFYFLAAEVVVIIAWFALLFTGRYPQGMYDFVAGALRYQTRVYGYAGLLTDQYPPFSGDPATAYPVDLVIGPPKEEYSRLKVLFRLILAIPVLIIQYAMQIVAEVGAIIAWFAIVILGRQPKGLQDMIALGMSYQQRATAYLALLTEDWPPFTDDTTRSHRRGGAGVRRAGAPRRRPQARSRRPRCRRAATPRPSARRPSRPRRHRSPASRSPRSSRRPPSSPARAAPAAPPAAAPSPSPSRPLTSRHPRRPPATRSAARPRRRPAAPEPVSRARALRAPRASPPSPGDWPDPPPREPRADDDEDEPPPGPFGPSSTNP